MIRAHSTYSNKKILKTATCKLTFDRGHCSFCYLTESHVLNGVWPITIVAKCVMSLVCLLTQPCFFRLVCGLSWPPSTSHAPSQPRSWCSHLSPGSSSQLRLSLGHLSVFHSGVLSVRCGRASQAPPVWWILALIWGGYVRWCVWSSVIHKSWHGLAWEIAARGQVCYFWTSSS